MPLLFRPSGEELSGSFTTFLCPVLETKRNGGGGIVVDETRAEM